MHHPFPTTSPETSTEDAHQPFTGLWVPLVTPFQHGAVDHAALARLTRHLFAQGITGVVACGSTGEAAALSDAERLQVLETVLSAAEGRPVVMGLSGYHLGDTVDGVHRLARYPLAGLLVPPPHYIRPAQTGLLQWFHAIADAAPAPLVIYDIPYRTGTVLETDTLLTLAAHPRIQAIKDCGGNPAKTQALLADGRLAVLAGEDAQIFTTLALGGAGAIAACAHWQTQELIAMMQALASGDLVQARRLWCALQPWIATCFAEPNPAPVKALLALHGWMQPELRAPMTPATPALRERMQALWPTVAAHW